MTQWRSDGVGRGEVAPGADLGGAKMESSFFKLILVKFHWNQVFLLFALIFAKFLFFAVDLRWGAPNL